MTRPAECPSCGKPRPTAACPGCGRPVGDSAAKLRAYLLRLFAEDETACGVIRDGFTALMSPKGGACANELDALLAAFREAVATYPEGLA